MENKIRILYFEDTPANAEQAFIQISMNGVSFSHSVADSKNEFADSLISFNPDLILADYCTAKSEGKEALSLRNEIAPSVPFIFITVGSNEKTVSDYLGEGADNYLLIDDLTRLVTVVRKAFEKRGKDFHPIRTRQVSDFYHKHFNDSEKSDYRGSLSLGIEEGISREDYDLIEEKLTILDMAMESAGIGSWVFDRTGNKRYFDNKASQLLGFVPGSFKKTESEFFDAVHPADRNKVRVLLEAAIDSKNDLETEFRVVFPTGQERFLTARAKVIVDHSGEVIRLIGLLWDITEQKLLQMKLQENIRRTNSIVSNLNGAFFRWKPDEHWTMEYVSDGIKELTGYPSGDFIMNKLRTFGSVIIPSDRERVRMAVSEALKSKLPYTLEYRITSSENKIKWIWERGRGLFSDGVVIAVEGFFTDISDKKKVEEELKSALDQQHQLTQYVEKVREDERVAISRELHDDLGQALTAVKIDLGTIRQITHDKEVALKVKKVSDLVSDTIKTVQRLTSQLRPQIIDDLGLVSAIEWYTSEFEDRSHIRISLDLSPELNIEPDTSMIIFRIMQEALTNVARHSKATKVEIELIQRGNDLCFRMADNGIGITENQLASKKSFGIISMKERAGSLGGTFEISGGHEGGTVIKLIFPLNLTGNHESTDL
jgi:two-component system sensor histidine kinase UhpB